MNKIRLLLVVVFIFCILVVGCDNPENVTNLNVDDAVPKDYGAYEWISPDGVHYWVVTDYYRYGIAPRYNSDGELVVEKENENE